MSERIAIVRPPAQRDPLPLVAVAIANSRPLDHPWVKECFESVKAQTYALVETVVVDNRDHHYTIGRAWNEAVRATEAPYVLFVGDDDKLALDLVASLVGNWPVVEAQFPELACLTTCCTFLHEGTNASGHMPPNFMHTGMWLREFLLRHPFNETLAKGVDTAHVGLLDRMSALARRPMRACLTHHFGYVWRQHVGMASGMRMSATAQSPLAIA